MTDDALERLADHQPDVVVVGDAILDVWLSGHCDRISREAPAPVVDVGARVLSAGGAANTAVNLAALGARARFVTVLGDDESGRELRDLLGRQGVDTRRVVLAPGRRTVRKHRVVADDQVLVRFDDGDAGPAPPVTEELRAASAQADAVLVCDYGNGLLDDEVRDAVAGLDVPLLVVDAHDLSRWRGTRPDLVTPDANEAAKLLDLALPADRAELFQRHQADLLDATGAKAVVVTLDRDGALLLRPDARPYRTWSDPAPDSQASGAGDTFVAALCLAVSAGLAPDAGMELAQAASSVVVYKRGTSVCTWTELAAAVHRDAVLSPGDLADLVDRHHDAGRTVVFTNGCFDVLHRGHISYLNEAKRQGDVLVVAVNSDDSVRRLKGPDRPVNSAQDRAAVLSALSCVDHVTVFDQDTPIELLLRLEPELYVKGGDYTESMLAEAPVVRSYGGEVRSLGYVPEKSTSSMIEKIRTSEVPR